MEKKNKKPAVKEILALLLIIAFFIFSSYLAKSNIEYLESLLKDSLSGMLIYISITIFATVVAPFSSIPFIPIASSIWGWQITGLLSIVGWLIGGILAFLLARYFGMPIVKKLASAKKIESAENYLPRKNVFWSIVFLRMVIPVDILSYALGLFSSISLWKYSLATLIGITPFAFAWAYAGTLSIAYQLIALAIALAIILSGILVKKKIRKRKS